MNRALAYVFPFQMTQCLYFKTQRPFNVNRVGEWDENQYNFDGELMQWLPSF